MLVVRRRHVQRGPRSGLHRLRSRHVLPNTRIYLHGLRRGQELSRQRGCVRHMRGELLRHHPATLPSHYLTTTSPSLLPSNQGGTYAGRGAHECTDCKGGTYSIAGSERCISCVNGTYSGPASDTCTKCEAGTFSARTGSTNCEDW